jgi:low affinity Fe/Cu permease
VAEIDDQSPRAETEERRRQLDAARHEVDNRPRGPLRSSSPSRGHADAWQERPWSSRLIHFLSGLASDARTALWALVLVLAWGGVGVVTRFPTWWQVVLYSMTSSVTFVMVFILQHAQDRQTSASQRKLDELIRSSQADDALIAVEETGDEHLQALANLNFTDRQRATEPTAD